MSVLDRLSAWRAARFERLMVRYRLADRPARSVGRRVGRGMLLGLVFVALVAAAAAPAALAVLVFAPLPTEQVSLAPLESEPPPSTILAADGSLLASFDVRPRRVSLTAEQLPQVFIDVLVASEDRRFFSHHGVDWMGVARAVKANREAGRVVEGGSTITQQLVKVRSGDDDVVVDRKVREAVAALQLDRSTPKREILAAYANSVYFGSGYTGLESASQGYFGHPAAQLSLAEAALLVGVLPSPTVWSPRVDPIAAETRRQQALDRVETFQADPEFPDGELERYSADELTWARAAVPPLVPEPQPVTSEPWFVAYVRQWMKVTGLDESKLLSGGLEVSTTLDPVLQAAARDAAWREFPAGPGPDVALAAVDPWSGAVRAMVSGRDFAVSQVDMARGRQGGGSGRQPGSTAKVFTLAAWFAEGRAADELVDAPASVQPDGWKAPVTNSSGRGYGQVTVAAATEQSFNTAFVNMAAEVGLGKVAEMGVRVGSSSIADRLVEGRVDPSMVLGAVESSPLEMASVYSTFASGGVFHAPSPVQKIVDRTSGRVLFDLDEVDAAQVIDQSVAASVTSTLEGVVVAGTGGNAAVPGVAVAGKTGTSSDNADIWFAGSSPRLSVAVWAGRPEGRVPLRDPRTGKALFGGDGPARVFASVIAADAVQRGPVGAWFAGPAADTGLVGGVRIVAGERSDRVDPPSGSRPRAPRVDPPVAPTTTTTTVAPTTTTTTTTSVPRPTTTSVPRSSTTSVPRSTTTSVPRSTTTTTVP